jgi:hypothetical protein
LPTTSSSGLRFPASSDTPNVPQDIQNLAVDADRKVVPAFSTAAARNSVIPSPTQGQCCTVGGVLNVHDGSGWRSTRYGQGNTVTDGSGLITVAHNGGSTPLAWGVSPMNQSSDVLNTIVQTLAFAENATSLIIRAIRTDTNQYLISNPVKYSWWARF